MKYLIAIYLLLLVFVGAHAKSTDEFLLDFDTVKLTKIITGHDVIQATINGQQGRFILDTGATTVINERALSAYKLKTKLKTFDAAGAGGPIQISYYAVDTVEIGNTVLPVKQLGVTDLDQVLGGIQSFSSVKIDGIIGQDIFIKGQAVLDIGQSTLSFPRDRLTEYTTTQFITEDHALLALKQINFKAHGFMLHGIEVVLNGVEKMLILDSGASRTMLNKSTLSAFNLNHFNGEISSSAGAGGGFNIQKIFVNGLSISHGHVDLEQVYGIDLSAVVTYVKQQTGMDVYGVLGQDVLSQLDAVIIPSTNQIFLKFK